MDSGKFIKIKVNLILGLINLLKKSLYFVFWFFEKIGQGIFAFLFLSLKIILFLFFSLYLKIKKLIKEFFLRFYYQGGFFSFFPRTKIVIPFLILVFVFIIFEQKIMPEERVIVKVFPVLEKLEKKEEVSESDFKIAMTDENEESVLSPNQVFDQKFILTRTEIERYEVQPGDTISSIAEDFEVSINTILWENNLTSRSIIRPGQILKILPISGVSHKVKKGETIEKIARFYRAGQEDIISFNNLEEEPLIAGDLIIVPEGKIPPPPVVPLTYRRLAQDKIWPSELGERTKQGNNCRDFYPGQCTWYVAQKYCIPWSGHAKSWLANAKKFGFQTGQEPIVGAIISLQETWYGHIGIVVEVNENSIIISEMNHLGPWKVNKRELKINDRRINGYIYIK